MPLLRPMFLTSLPILLLAAQTAFAQNLLIIERKDGKKETITIDQMSPEEAKAAKERIQEGAKQFRDDEEERKKEAVEAARQARLNELERRAIDNEARLRAAEQRPAPAPEVRYYPYPVYDSEYCRWNPCPPQVNAWGKVPLPGGGHIGGSVGHRPPPPPPPPAPPSSGTQPAGQGSSNIIVNPPSLVR